MPSLFSYFVQSPVNKHIKRTEDSGPNLISIYSIKCYCTDVCNARTQNVRITFGVQFGVQLQVISAVEVLRHSKYYDNVNTSPIKIIVS